MAASTQGSNPTTSSARASGTMSLSGQPISQTLRESLASERYRQAGQAWINEATTVQQTFPLVLTAASVLLVAGYQYLAGNLELRAGLTFLGAWVVLAFTLQVGKSKLYNDAYAVFLQSVEGELFPNWVGIKPPTIPPLKFPTKTEDALEFLSKFAPARYGKFASQLPRSRLTKARIWMYKRSVANWYYAIGLCVSAGFFALCGQTVWMALHP
jgi:hypothetical protein